MLSPFNLKKNTNIVSFIDLDFGDQRVTEKSWLGYFVFKNSFFNVCFTQKNILKNKIKHLRDFNKLIYGLKNWSKNSEFQKFPNPRSTISRKVKVKEHQRGTLHIKWNPLTPRSTVFMVEISDNDDFLSL